MMNECAFTEAGYELRMTNDGMASFADLRAGGNNTSSRFFVRAEDLKFLRKLIDEADAIVSRDRELAKHMSDLE
jgi:hypothetical protein